jgi:hypothetical protein
VVQKLNLIWFRKHKTISALLILFILILGLSVYQAVALRTNKHNFEQARVAIDTVYADIVTKVGPPDNYKRTNECSRPNQEFGQGPLSCDVSSEFIYGVEDEQQANNLLKQIQDSTRNHPSLLKPVAPLSSSIPSKFVANTYFHTAVDRYKTASGMGCTVKYAYDTPLETPLKLIRSSNNKTFYVTLGCLDWAKSQYYPLHE